MKEWKEKNWRYKKERSRLHSMHKHVRLNREFSDRTESRSKASRLLRQGSSLSIPRIDHTRELPAGKEGGGESVKVQGDHPKV